MKSKSIIILVILTLLTIILIMINFSIYKNTSPKFISIKSKSNFDVILEIELAEINNFVHKQYFIKPQNRDIQVEFEENKYTVLDALDTEIIKREDLERNHIHFIIVVVDGFIPGEKVKIAEDDNYIYSYPGTYSYNIMYKKTNNTIEEALAKKVIDLDILYKILPFDVEDKETGVKINYSLE